MSENKPNSPIVQMNVTYFMTTIYAIFTSLTEVKNKPNQTQFKANSNPICYNAIIGLSSFMTSKYVRLGTMPGKKTKPNKPDLHSCPRAKGWFNFAKESTTFSKDFFPSYGSAGLSQDNLKSLVRYQFLGAFGYLFLDCLTKHLT